MAKTTKKTKEVVVNDKQEVKDDTIYTAKTEVIDDETVKELLCTNPYPTNPDNINRLTIFDLLNYYEACKVICIHYEKEINLNELEKRNYSSEIIKHNREKFITFSSIHRRLRELIENKLEKITEYEGW